MTGRIGFWQAWIAVWTVWDVLSVIWDLTRGSSFTAWMGVVVLACWVATFVVSYRMIRHLRREAAKARDWHEAIR